MLDACCWIPDTDACWNEVEIGLFIQHPAPPAAEATRLYEKLAFISKPDTSIEHPASFQ